MMVSAESIRLGGVLLLYAVILGVVAATTPISPSEAHLFYSEPVTLVTLMMHTGESVLPGVFGMRLPFLILGVINGTLFYHLAGYHFRNSRDRWIALFFYLMLPGIVISSTLANTVVPISTLLLLFLLLYYRRATHLALIPFLLLSCLHWSVLYFYMLMLLYSLFQKERWLFVASVAGVLCYLLVGMPLPESSGENHFLEMLSINVMIFSPWLFLYLFYALYRTLLSGERDLIWYLSFGMMIIALVLSLQMRIRITDFSAYMMPGVIVAVRTYYRSLRVRLPIFRRRYRILFWIVTVSLIVSTLALLLHQPIYRWAGATYYRFVVPVYEPYDKALQLHSEGKSCLGKIRRKYRDQMRYYQIDRCF